MIKNEFLRGAISMAVFLAVEATFAQSPPKERYVLTLELSQSHFTTDLWEHAKDAMNKATFDLPVDKEFYDSVQPGTNITDKFRAGSFLVRGSLGSWKVRVKSKHTQQK